MNMNSQRHKARESWEVNREIQEEKDREKRERTAEMSLRRYRRSRRAYARQLMVHEKLNQRKETSSLRTYPKERNMHLTTTHNIFEAKMLTDAE